MAIERYEDISKPVSEPKVLWRLQPVLSAGSLWKEDPVEAKTEPYNEMGIKMLINRVDKGMIAGGFKRDKHGKSTGAIRQTGFVQLDQKQGTIIYSVNPKRMR